MAKAGLQFSKQDEWLTPDEIWSDVLPDIDYDPCTTDAQAKKHGILRYDTIQTDGLKRDWTQFSTIYVNPPFTRKFEFLKKAVDSVKATKSQRIYFLIPIDSLPTKKFHDTVGDAKYVLMLPNGRIKFDNGSGKSSSPAFGSVILLFSSLGSSRRVAHVKINVKKEKNGKAA